MILKTVDLYEYFGLKKNEYTDGVLTCYIQECTDAVNTERRFPSVVIFPGGAYRYLSPREAEPLAMRYYAVGFSGFVLSYSIAPLSFPTALREAAMAIRYLRENADELSLAPNKIAALGCSAGGHLLGTLSTLYNSEFVPESLHSARPDASIYCYPVVTTGEKSNIESVYNISGGNEQIASMLSVEKLVHKDCPMAFIWHTYEDTSVPVKNSLLLAGAYEDAGVPFEMHIFSQGGHGMSTCDEVSNRSDNVPKCSTLTPKWIELSIKWLADNGIKIED